MNPETFIQSPLVANVAITLLHSIWQISFVAIGLAVALRLLRKSSAELRYGVSVAALAIAFILPLLTFAEISRRDSAETASQRLRSSASATTLAGGASVSPTMSDEMRPIDADRAASTDQRWFSAATAWWTRNLPNTSAAIVILWLLGVAFFGVRLFGGFHQLRRYRTSEIAVVDESWQNVFEDLCERVGIRQPVTILKSLRIQTPIAVGVLKPVILIPAGLFLQISPRELETIIAHELIHIRRYDPLVNLAQCFIEACLFYHPAMWWISAVIRREREFAADAAVIENFDSSHVTYARALANLEEIRRRTNEQPPRYATAANGGNFMQRIQRILKIRTEASNTSSAWTAGLALVLTSVFVLTLFSFSSSELVNAQNRSTGRKLAVAFVSIPPTDRTANPPKDADATARLLIQELKEHRVPALGILQGGMISDGEKLYPVRANIARMWIDAGFELGLGGFKHIWLYDTPVDEYIANIEKNEKVAKQLIGDMGLPPRYFSYPFLNTGRSVEDKAKVEAWLASRGYTSVKYTFDNSEWMYSYAYDMARNDNDLNTMKEIRQSYLDYMSRMFDHYEAYSAELFGRDIPQTLVLTPSRLITDTADEFFGMAAKRGYSFVTVDEAQADAAYKTREDFVGKAGISWFERWTMAKGSKLRNEPQVDASVQRTWEDRKKAEAK